MIRRLQSKFSLDAFDGRLTNRRSLSRYLAIYLQNIAPENRTETNELISFLENPLGDRRIIYFGLLYGETPCGFLSLMHYPAESVAIADHIAIDTKVRGIGAFFSFVDLIADYMESEGLSPDYVVAEIMKRTQSLQGDVDPLQLIRLLRVIGFRVLQIPYVAPHGGITKHPNRYKSALMVIPRQPIKEIPGEECKKLIELIYYGHYLKWYQRVWKPTQVNAYKKALDSCFTTVSKRLAVSTFIRLNGASIATNENISADIKEHARDYVYAAIILVPTILTLAVSLAQELWVTAGAVGITLIVLLFIFFVPRLRSKIMRFFRPE